MKKRNTDFSSFYRLLFPFHKRKLMFAVLHSDINSLKSGLLHLTGQPYCKKSRSEKVKDGIINLFLWKSVIDRYRSALIDKVNLKRPLHCINKAPCSEYLS